MIVTRPCATYAAKNRLDSFVCNMLQDDHMHNSRVGSGALSFKLFQLALSERRWLLMSA